MSANHHPDATGTATRRSGFTLFEVAISMVIMTFAILSSVLLFPVGIKAQQMARLRLLAAAKAQEMVETFAAADNANHALDVEAPNPWDVPVGYRSLAWDLELRLSSHRYGIMPLPTATARRLDSDDDEIARVLDEGGQLYYAQPHATSQIIEKYLQPAPANETQKLVFAVVGCAQNDAVAYFPWKSWPYTATYPSPPSYGACQPEWIDGQSTAWRYGGWFINRQPAYCWETTTDPDIEPVFTAYRAYTYDFQGNNADPTANAINLERVVAYVQAALWYCARKGVDPTFYDPPDDGTSMRHEPLSGPPSSRCGSAQPWQEVQAMRFLAHAATCMTRWKSLDELGGQYPAITGPGFAIAPLTIWGAPSPAVALTHDRILYYHESCLALAMRYAASYPYDWGAPRPIQRSIMMDYPLIEHDLFTPPLTGTVFGAPGVAAAQWRPIPAAPIANLGRSFSFPNVAIPATIWGQPRHFTLTRPFAAAERSRELVFWSADWQAYEDFETTPSAAVDASKYALSGPLKDLDGAWTTQSWSDGGGPVDAPVDDAPFIHRMNAVDFRDEFMSAAFRNPEKTLLYTVDPTGIPSGTDMRGSMVLNKDFYADGGTIYADGYPDQGFTAGKKRVFSGRHGADRNFNYRLDRGPVPASTRLRAALIGRFVFYDPRLPMPLR